MRGKKFYLKYAEFEFEFELPRTIWPLGQLTNSVIEQQV